MNQSIKKLCDLFLKNELRCFKKELENSDVFFSSTTQYTTFGASLESAVMELCHGSCHELTIGLSELLGTEKIVLITDGAGFPIHSALLNDEGFILDSNGIHKIEDALIFWKSIIKETCKYTIENVEFLHLFAGSDDSVIYDTLIDFELVAKFTLDNLKEL